MIYDYKKYKGIAEFVADTPLSKRSNQFTVVNKCKGCTIVREQPTLNHNCFGCLFCAINDIALLTQMKNMFGCDFVSIAAHEAFKGVPVKPQITQKGLRPPYASLEKFTSVDETTNIQPWAAALLHHICSTENRISMEVPIFNYGYERNGRLDICSITPNHLMVMESKTTLDDALADERFIEQHTKYTEVIDKITRDYTYITLIGGKETDIYPTSSAFCTGIIGNKAARFHQMLINNNIQVLTANALWCLCCKYLIEGNRFSWDHFLVDALRTPECIGLVSAGLLIVQNGHLTIQSIF